jgi:hypothetical protein
VTETIEPMPAQIDQQQFAQDLVDRARTDGVDLVGPGGLLTGLTTTVLETALEAEMSDHLGYDKHDPDGRQAWQLAQRPSPPLRHLRDKPFGYHLAVPHAREPMAARTTCSPRARGCADSLASRWVTRAPGRPAAQGVKIVNAQRRRGFALRQPRGGQPARLLPENERVHHRRNPTDRSQPPSGERRTRRRGSRSVPAGSLLTAVTVVESVSFAWVTSAAMRSDRPSHGSSYRSSRRRAQHSAAPRWGSAAWTAGLFTAISPRNCVSSLVPRHRHAGAFESTWRDSSQP